MSAVKNTTTILSGVKRRAMIPTDNSTFSDSDLLAILNEEMTLGLLSTIMKVHEEFYVYADDQSITSGTTAFTISERAIGNKLRSAQLVDSSGNVSSVARILPEDEEDYSYAEDAFYLRNDQLIFVDSPTGAAYLRMNIYLRPNQLVAASRAATVSSVDTTTGIVTFTGTLPSHFTATGTYDFVSANAPCRIMNFDKTASAIDTSAYTLTFTASDLPSGLAAGDYVTFAEETIVPQLPVELIPILEQRAACYCLEAMGDMEGLEMAKRKLQEMETNVYTLIDNRTEGNPQKIVNRNSFIRKKRTGYYGY